MRSSLKGRGRIVYNPSKIQIASELWVMLLPGLATACALRRMGFRLATPLVTPAKIPQHLAYRACRPRVCHPCP